MNSRKNDYIELLRVILTLFVCLHHMRAISDSMPYGGASICVDGFYLLSGFFLIISLRARYASGKMLTIRRYAVSRYERVFASFLVAYVVAVLLRIVVLKEFFRGSVVGNVTELFLCEIYANSAGDRIIPPGWYLGYLLLGQIIVYAVLYLYLKKQKPTGNKVLSVLIRTLFAVGGYGYLCIKYGHICVYPAQEGFIDIDVLIRAVAGIVLGTLTADWCIHTEKTPNSTCRKVVFGIASVLLLGMLCVYIIFNNGWTRADYLMIIFLVLLVVSLYIYSNHVCLHKKISAIIHWLGNVCFTTYLNHYVIIHIFEEKGVARNWDWKAISTLLFAVVLLFSIAIFCIETALRKGFLKIQSLCKIKQ